MDELEDIVRLQEIVYEAVANKDTFVLSTEEELAESLSTDVCFGAYQNGVLIGFTLMVTNPNSPRNLGFYLNYSLEQRLRCVTYETTFVHPDYKGRGLQRLFISIKDRKAGEMEAHEALATVSPNNAASLKNLKAGGFEIAGQRKMYGNLDRYIMRKFFTPLPPI